MDDQLNVNVNMTKKEIIDKYTELLEAFKEKAKSAEQTQKLVSESEKHRQVNAVQLAQEATVSKVVDNVGKLRIQIGEVLNDLTDKMNTQAEKLVSLTTAIKVQEKRLTELHDIEAASDSLSKLMQAYEERKLAMEQDYAQRMAELEAKYRDKSKILETDSTEKMSALKKEMEDVKFHWKEEKDSTDKARQREQTEYVYERDRMRKIEENEYAEKRKQLEKQLEELKQTGEKELAEREKAISQQEAELDSLRKQVDEFPSKLESVRTGAEQGTASRLQKELELTVQSLKSNHAWENKIHEERIKHLEETINSQKEKFTELKTDFELARRQVESIANKAVEGASLTKAFQSVNQIALEQARRPEREE